MARDCLENFRIGDKREKSVLEYTNKFFKVSIHNGPNEGDEQLAIRYVNGLNYTI